MKSMIRVSKPIALSALGSIGYEHHLDAGRLQFRLHHEHSKFLIRKGNRERSAYQRTAVL
jgi:hypothetical protein